MGWGVPGREAVTQGAARRGAGSARAPAERQRAHRLHEVGVDEEALLGAQLDPRQKVRE